MIMYVNSVFSSRYRPIRNSCDFFAFAAIGTTGWLVTYKLIQWAHHAINIYFFWWADQLKKYFSDSQEAWWPETEKWLTQPTTHTHTPDPQQILLPYCGVGVQWCLWSSYQLNDHQSLLNERSLQCCIYFFLGCFFCCCAFASCLLQQVFLSWTQFPM